MLVEKKTNERRKKKNEDIFLKKSIRNECIRSKLVILTVLTSGLLLGNLWYLVSFYLCLMCPLAKYRHGQSTDFCSGQ